MPAAFWEIVVTLKGYPVLWAVAVIAAMAATAVILYIFWDLVGKVISLAARVLNMGRPGRRE